MPAPATATLLGAAVASGDGVADTAPALGPPVMVRMSVLSLVAVLPPVEPDWEAEADDVTTAKVVGVADELLTPAELLCVIEMELLMLDEEELEELEELAELGELAELEALDEPVPVVEVPSPVTTVMLSYVPESSL